MEFPCNHSESICPSLSSGKTSALRDVDNNTDTSLGKGSVGRGGRDGGVGGEEGRNEMPCQTELNIPASNQRPLARATQNTKPSPSIKKIKITKK